MTGVAPGTYAPGTDWRNTGYIVELLILFQVWFLIRICKA